MTRRTIAIVSVVAVLTLLSPVLSHFLTAQETNSGTQRILLGPDIRVSHDGEVAHAEMMVSANPVNAKQLIGASTVLAGEDGAPVVKSYASVDGGYTWFDFLPPDQLTGWAGDPQAIYGATGTPFFVALEPGKKGAPCAGMCFYRSTDAGHHWAAPLTVSAHGDHEQIVVDNTNGRFRGRIYLAAETGTFKDKLKLTGRVSTVQLFTSSDDGKSFSGPVAAGSRENRGLAVYPLMVLSDGTLAAPLLEYPNWAEDQTTSTAQMWLTLSTDGGASFGPMTKVQEIYHGSSNEMDEWKGRFDSLSDPVYAADTFGNHFRDRIYVVWADFRHRNPRLLFSSSSDRGKSWTTVKEVSPGQAADTSQFMPKIEVNRGGVLGIMWYDTRDVTDRSGYDLYFTASLDGGETFLPPTRVSSQSSFPAGAGNIRPSAYGQEKSPDDDSLAVEFLSGWSRWPNGGDYMGMTSDIHNVFHPLWADARSGVFQIYTCPITVGAEPKRIAGLVEAPLNRQMKIVLEPVEFSADRHGATFPVRLKNDSKQPLYPPFKVEVRSLVNAYSRAAKMDFGELPRFTNAENGKEGDGAVFDYSKALRDQDVLAPGAVTMAMPWKLHLEHPEKVEWHFDLNITGFVKK
jgi:hypothetical protein